ncbi:MAG: glutathione S-transferase family protein [Gammaproteobacteria bacterium]|nr:glutathione S-transferase family protein [Gammaproteobacteria bacterium]MDH4315208.1 glutathione S-transferase family protein [Gammaproteobacteria bacterium]MDH5215218.1 glutathione S-transferase family protein [Gammaproteobacteria bacterium]MDH5502246.1 glutathione S-transferase family protein [Gammaproteobacteria bacterium]
MAKYKLIYFDFDGGRGEPVRIAFHIAGIEFEDERLNFAEFTAMRESTPFHSVPVLEIDGTTVTQSNAHCRFVGKLANIYPEDDLQALYCDEVLDVIEEISHRISPTMSMKGDEQRTARGKLVEGTLSTYLRGLAGLLKRGGGKYFANGSLTIADLKVFVQVRWLRSGKLDHIPKDLVDRLAPSLVQHYERVAKDPRVVAYYASRA